MDLASPQRVRKSCSPQLPGRRPGPVLSGGPQVRVGVQSGGCGRVPESSLDGHDITLELARHRELPPQEVDVTNLHAGRFTQA